ncbi:MAG TPA: tRNA (guanosine(37)-N1)-methyltransferase TrmD [Thermodesulfobacteriota bacterium]|nr:tRNA (guanosine(37)-N1)-methyltransferase TrmD [Thermodesulfobacteriota bacterium]
MRFDILTLFPEFFTSPLEQSLLGKAIAKGVLTVSTRNLRDFTTDKHRTTDDSPYGGGHGMVMKVEPVVAAIEALRAEGPAGRVILTTPQGVPLTQSLARELSGEERLIIVCGRYEGVDERIRAFVDTEISLGDFVLTGGEVAALALVDSVGRLVPGVLGEPGSVEHDSFSDGLLEYPQYTRPEDFRGLKVPEVLLSGNHAEIERWRRTESLERTAERRPDLIEKAGLTEAEKRLVKKISGPGA